MLMGPTWLREGLDGFSQACGQSWGTRDAGVQDVSRNGAATWHWQLLTHDPEELAVPPLA